MPVRINSGGDLAFLDGQITGPPDRLGPLFSGDGGRLFNEALHRTITLSSGHREDARVLWLAARKREGGFDRGAKRVFINAIRGGARGSAIDDRANRNRQPVLGDVLVNGVVGETRQRVRNFVHVDFRLFGSCGFRQTKNRADDAPKLALVEKLGGSCACPC